MRTTKVVRTGKPTRSAPGLLRRRPGARHSPHPKVKGGALGAKPFQVLKPGANPPQSFYDKSPDLKPGLNFVTCATGSTESGRLPSGKTMDDGPFPTFIEYSGYQAAAPYDLLQSIIPSWVAATAR